MTENEDLVRSWIDLWNEHAVDRLPRLVSPSYVRHAMTGRDLDIDGFCEGFRAVLAAFGGLSYRIEHLAASDDLVAVYLLATATHTGAFLGVAATGLPVTIRGAYHCRVLSGTIAEDWDVFDLLTPLLHLGAAITAPAAT